MMVAPLPPKTTELYCPVGAVDYIEHNGLSGNLLVSLSWGEYAFWRLYPELRWHPEWRQIYHDAGGALYGRAATGNMTVFAR